MLKQLSLLSIQELWDYQISLIIRGLGSEIASYGIGGPIVLATIYLFIYLSPPETDHEHLAMSWTTAHHPRQTSPTHPPLTADPLPARPPPPHIPHLQALPAHNLASLSPLLCPNAITMSTARRRRETRRNLLSGKELLPPQRATRDQGRFLVAASC